jgi:hypothetical protein
MQTAGGSRLNEAMKKGIIVGVVLFMAWSLLAQSAGAITSYDASNGIFKQTYRARFIRLDGAFSNVTVNGIPYTPDNFWTYGDLWHVFRTLNFTLEWNLIISPFHRVISNCSIHIIGFIGCFLPAGNIHGYILIGFVLIMHVCP